MSSTTSESRPVRREFGPSWVVVSRLIAAVNVGLVFALLLVTTLHGFGVHEGVVTDFGLALLTVATLLLVSWPKGEPSL